MGLLKRNKIYYADYYKDGERIVESLRTTNKKLAQDILNKKKTDIVINTHLNINDREKILFHEMVKEFLEKHSKANKKKSFSRDVGLCRNLEKRLGSRLLHQITGKDVQKYKMGRQKDGVKESTINRELAALRSIFNRAKEWGYLVIDVPKLGMFNEEKFKRERYLTREEEQNICEIATEPIKSVIVVAINSGMRLSEILVLKWGDLDFDKKTMRLRETKAGKPQSVEMNSIVYNLLEGRRTQQKGSDYIFPGLGGSKPLNTNYISRKFRRLASKARVKDAKFHDCRHTFASRLAILGVPIYTLKKLMRHSSITLTERYAHLAPSTMHDAVERLCTYQDGTDQLQFGYKSNKSKSTKDHVTTYKT